MARKYRLTTLGCKVNQYESQQLREALDSIGFQPAAAGESADLAVVNTCAVTAVAARKSRQSIRRITDGGRVPAIVVGCYATQAAEVLRRIPGVAAVIGHESDIRGVLRDFASRRLELRADLHPSIPLPDGSVNGGTDGIIHAFDGHQRAFLKVQDGCDACCTYCIVPHLRPRLSSKPIPTAVEEAGGLVRAGHREIVVTGIYLGAYGRLTALRHRQEGNGSPLADLVEALAGVEGLVRLRLSSLEPGDLDDRLLAVLCRCECCVPHLHLPLQSGSDAVLRRMNRQYNSGQYVEMLRRVRDALDRPAISTDIVVGFPGETDADFEQTLAVARQAGFCKIHAFPFSPRPGTAAARWTDQFVHAHVVRDRMRALACVGRQSTEDFVRGFVGCMERVIVEGPPDADTQSLHSGRTDRYFEVQFEAADARPGDVVGVRIDGVGEAGAHGTRTIAD